MTTYVSHMLRFLCFWVPCTSFCAMTAFAEQKLLPSHTLLVKHLNTTGTILYTVDGDTVAYRPNPACKTEVACHVNHQTYRIRLAELDAPERMQPGGQEAKTQLSEWVDGATVHLRVVDMIGIIVLWHIFTLKIR